MTTQRPQTRLTPSHMSMRNDLLHGQVARGQDIKGDSYPGSVRGCDGHLHREAGDVFCRSEVSPGVEDILNAPGEPLDATTRAFMETRFSHDFSGVKSNVGAASTIQTGIKIGPVNDSLEQAAHRTAEHILKKPSMVAPAKSGIGDIFSSVRVHTDQLAAESAQEVGAQAYTVGRHVVFDTGKYNPSTVNGQRLLAHELTHVIQQIGTANAQRRASSFMPAGEVTKPTVQRQSVSGTIAPPGRGTRRATREERREFAQDAIRFLEEQGEAFALQLDRDPTTHLRHLQTTVESALAAITGDPAAAGLVERLQTGYRGAVRTTLVARTRIQPGQISVRTPPTLRELYEQYRDNILPFGLPRVDVDIASGELSAELNASLPAHPSAGQRRRHTAVQSARQRLRVVTSSVEIGIEDLFSTQGGTVTIPLPERTTARFSSSIPSSLHHGLRNIAGSLMRRGSALEANTTVLLALDLMPFGGGYDAYRFTRLDLGGLGQEVLIERQGGIGVEGLRTQQRAALQQRFDRFGFRRGSGFSQQEFDQVLIGLGEIPDAHLSSLGNLRFERHSSNSARPDAAADYDQTGHTIRVFDRAYSGGSTRVGRPGRVLTIASYTIVHEVGHALDLYPLRTAASATSTAQDALLAEFGTGGGAYRIPHRRDPERARYDELQRGLRSATTAENAARSRSGARWSGGNPSSVVDDLARGARQPAFRAAVLHDGGPTGRQMPTTYPNPASVWQEYFAESFALYETSPDLLRRIRPNVYRYFEREFPR